MNDIEQKLLHIEASVKELRDLLTLPPAPISETEYLLASSANATHLGYSLEQFSSGMAVRRELIQEGEDFSQAQPGPYRCKHGCERDGLMDRIHALENGLHCIVGETK